MTLTKPPKLVDQTYVSNNLARSITICAKGNMHGIARHVDSPTCTIACCLRSPLGRLVARTPNIANRVAHLQTMRQIRQLQVCAFWVGHLSSAYTYVFLVNRKSGSRILWAGCNTRSLVKGMFWEIATVMRRQGGGACNCFISPLGSAPEDVI